MANHITIIINVDQQAAIRAGIAYFGETQALTIDLDNFTPEERAALAELWDGKKIYIGSTFDFGGTYPRCLPTEEGLRSMLQAGLAKRADRLVREAQERAQGERQACEAGERALAAPLEEWVVNHYTGGPWEVRCPYRYEAHRYESAYLAVPGLLEKKQEAEAEVERRNAQREADLAQRKIDEAQKEAELKQRAAENEQKLREWALARGSELLRERIAGGYKWIGLAHDEFTASVMLNGFGPPAEVDHSEPRMMPTLEEIRALRIVREAVAGNPVYGEPQLVWNRVQDEDETDDDGDPVLTTYASICVDVTRPDGSSTTIEKRL